VSAGREVILSGGSVNSPQLLQLAGIGPADHLKNLGINVRIDNPNVGRNLEDHIGINYTYRANCPTINQQLGPWWGKLSAGIRYLAFRDGPLSVSLNQAGGFIRTSPDRVRPNMQLYFQAFSTVIPRPGERPILSPDPWPGFSIGWSNCRPKSRGEIMIRSSDPSEAPRITPNALSHEDDVAEMLATGKIVREMAAARPLADCIDAELLPGPDITSDEALIDDIRRRSGTVYHPVSTCRMGPDPATSVVDPRLRVHGLQGLRVVDCSIFPNIVTGNTNAAAIATGWRASQLVLQDAG
jgi:choline dehydrogenase